MPMVSGLGAHDGAAAGAAFARVLAMSRSRAPLDRMLDADLKLWLPDDLALKMDKMSMAASIEARVPLFDHPLVECAASLPASLKARGLGGKHPLKRLARKRLPAAVVDRPKVGFTVPLPPWFRGPLRGLVAGTLLSPVCLGRRYYDLSQLRATGKDHLVGRRDRARELWTLLTLELWHRTFIDQVPRPPTAWKSPARARVEASIPTP